MQDKVKFYCQLQFKVLVFKLKLNCFGRRTLKKKKQPYEIYSVNLTINILILLPHPPSIKDGHFSLPSLEIKNYRSGEAFKKKKIGKEQNSRLFNSFYQSWTEICFLLSKKAVCQKRMNSFHWSHCPILHMRARKTNVGVHFIYKLECKVTKYKTVGVLYTIQQQQIGTDGHYDFVSP